MSMQNSQPTTHEYTSMDRAAHSLHESRTAEEFTERFNATAGYSIRHVVDQFVDPSAAKAVFAVGSLALGMGSSGSDVDLLVLVDDKVALAKGENHIANSAQELEFASSSDLLLPGIFLSMHAGILVDLQVAAAPAIHRIYGRLKRRGPELNETEMRTLGRLSSGWLLFETEGYMERNAALLRNPALPIYCCTKHFVSALHEISKARRALASQDGPLALHLGHRSVEEAYLAYFASEGLTYLGLKWLAQIGHARGAAERVRRHPLLAQGVPLLFPHYPASPTEIAAYLKAVAGFLTSMRSLIEQKTLFRIAFTACPQMHEV